MAQDTSSSGAMPEGRPSVDQFPDGDREPHHEGVPGGDEPAKGGPPQDDRLSSETAHAESSRREDGQGSKGEAG